VPDWRWAKAQGIAESALDPNAVSAVGARGIMQLMPATWAELCRGFGWRNVSPFSAPHNIFAGVFYQARMDRVWSGRGRSVAQRHALGLASYNAGPRSILAAQAACGDAASWPEIAPCLAAVTGATHARETIGYVQRVSTLRDRMP